MRGWSMGLFGGAIEGDEVHVPNPVSETWPALRSAISAHRGITGASFNDSLRRVQFKTWATLGHTLSAVVSPESNGSRVLVSTVVKWQSTGRQERSQIRKIAAEILADLGPRLDDISPLTRLSNAEDQAAASASAIAAEMAHYALLRDRGFISAEEFDDEKRRLLNGGPIDPRCTLTWDPWRGPRRPARDLKAERSAR
jgi:hypothetical protein